MNRPELISFKSMLDSFTKEHLTHPYDTTIAHRVSKLVQKEINESKGDSNISTLEL